MDVRCERCGTEYDFDDALLSERGTTVRCTQCGLQFKVFPVGSERPPERWLVRRVAPEGGQLEYKSLRELQLGIGRNEIGPEDLLTRGTEAPRPLGTIAELQPFFSTGPRQGGTLAGVAPPSAATVPKSQVEPPTEVMPAKRRVSTVIGLPPPPNQTEPLPAPPGSQGAPSTISSGGAPTTEPDAHSHPAETRPGHESPEAHGEPPTMQAAAPPMSEASDMAGRGALAKTQPSAQASPFGAGPPSTAARAGLAHLERTQRSQGELGRTLQSGQAPFSSGGVDSAAQSASSRRRIVSALSRHELGEDFAGETLDDASAYAGADLAAARSPGGDRRDVEPEVRHTPPMPSGPPPTAVTRPSDPVLSEGRPSPRPSPVPSSDGDRDSQSRISRPVIPAPGLPSQSVSDPVERTGAPTRRRARSRFIVGVVVLGTLGLIGATVGRKYLEGLVPKKEQPAAEDPRVDNLVTEAEKLLEAGDLEGAKQQLDRASALQANHPGLLETLAQVEVVRADIEWLRLRLLDPEQTERVAQVHRSLAKRVLNARTATDAALATKRDSEVLDRVEVDVLRLEGNVAGARKQLGSLVKSADEPQTAYALAALDLAEDEPTWPTVIERLDVAARADGGTGLARTALAYSLVRAGKVERARSVVEKLKAEATPSFASPLLADVSSFVARHETDQEEGGEEARVVEPTKLPSLEQVGGRSDDTPRTTPAPAPNDFRALLKRASDARSRGDLTAAHGYYEAALKESPGNTEALAGLAAIAQSRGDHAESAKLYDDVLAKNPSYLPALVARADQKWASGDRAGALRLYRRVTEQAGAGSVYGQRARARISQAERESAPKTPEPQPAPDPETTAPKGDASPHIDTTDLP